MAIGFQRNAKFIQTTGMSGNMLRDAGYGTGSGRMDRHRKRLAGLGQWLTFENLIARAYQ